MNFLQKRFWTHACGGFYITISYLTRSKQFMLTKKKSLEYDVGARLPPICMIFGIIQISFNGFFSFKFLYITTRATRSEKIFMQHNSKDSKRVGHFLCFWLLQPQNTNLLPLILKLLRTVRSVLSLMQMLYPWISFAFAMLRRTVNCIRCNIQTNGGFNDIFLINSSTGCSIHHLFRTNFCNKTLESVTAKKI